MRILTIGVVLATFGILAALPFRRYQSLPDASRGPAEATGPTQVEVGYDKLHIMADAPIPATASAVSEQPLATSELWVSSEPVTPPPNVRRDANLPLTYQDLAVPIRPGPHVPNLTPSEPEPEVDSIAVDHSVGLAMPAMPAMEPAELLPEDSVVVRDPAGNAAASVDPIETRETEPSAASNTAMSLASTGLAATSKTTTSQPANRLDRSESSPDRVRHWIRQPD